LVLAVYTEVELVQCNPYINNERQETHSTKNDTWHMKYRSHYDPQSSFTYVFGMENI